MGEDDAAASGERWAEIYDDWHPGHEEAAITTLTDLARGGGVLELMAQLAGLRLRHRWSGWQGEPFTAASRRHISLYERASAG